MLFAGWLPAPLPDPLHLAAACPNRSLQVTGSGHLVGEVARHEYIAPSIPDAHARDCPCRPAGHCRDPNRRVTEDLAADKLRRRPGGSGWQQGAAHRECQPTLAADCSYLSTAREPCPRSSRWNPAGRPVASCHPRCTERPYAVRVICSGGRLITLPERRLGVIGRTHKERGPQPGFAGASANSGGRRTRARQTECPIWSVAATGRQP